MKIRDLEELILNKKEEARAKIEANDIERAKTLRNEIKELVDKLALMKDLEEEAKNDIQNKGVVIGSDLKKSETETFAETLRNSYRGIITDAMKETNDENGGFVVPRDISTTINKLLREKNSLRELVGIEKVKTFEGARTFEVNAKQVPFDKVEEEGVFGDIANPTFKRVNYKTSKFGGILKTSVELLEDTAENLLGYVNGWLTDKMVATYNGLILAEADRVLTHPTAIKGYDDIKTILNTKLDPSLISGTIILTNQTGYNWLDTLKDKNDNYILKPLITDPSIKAVEGKIRVVVVTDETLAVKTKKIPFYIGNFKEFIKIFDRDVYSMEASKIAGDLWSKDQLGIKVRFRIDVKAIDEKAVVKGEVTQG